MLIKLQDEIVESCSKEHHCSYATNMSNYAIFKRVRKIEKSYYKLRHVFPPVRMELGSHWMDFHGI